jgi:flagellar motor switch protein FliN
MSQSSSTTSKVGNAKPAGTATPSAQLIALPELHPAPGAESGDASILESAHPLYQVKTRLQVCVGEATLTVGELLSAKEHQVVRLDRLVEQPVDLVLEGKVVARGQLVAVDDHFGVRITELPVPLQLKGKA